MNMLVVEPPVGYEYCTFLFPF